MEEEFGHLSNFGCIEISNGMCWLAAVTRESGYDTEIIDALPLKIKNNRLAEIILRKNPKYIGISACTMDIFAAADLAKRVKEGNPNVKTIIGGPHITAKPKETMERFPSFDIGVVGEGESTIKDLLDSLKNKKSISNVDGLVFRKNKSLSFTRPRSFVNDLDSLPLPAWDLLPNLKKYYFAPAWTQHSKAMTILTSRGCPFQCVYCDRKVFGNKIRYHNVEYIMKMVHTLHNDYGITHFRISDDNFIINKKLLFDFCNALIKEKLKITWSCLARADMINKEVLAKMKKAGCYSIAYGVETGSQKIHDFEKKNIKLEDIARAVKLTRKAGIKTISFNIIGHPLETIDTIKATIRFNKKIKVDEFKTQFMVPFPGTELYENVEKYGTFDKDWKNMAVFHEPIFIPHGLTKEDLIKWNKKGFMSFYTQPRIVWSYLTGINSFAEFKMIILGGLTILHWKVMELFGKKSK